jgi:hypothetical protein
LTYEEQIEWAKGEFKNLENKKQKIILELAKRLADADMVEDTICEYISEQLQSEGYVTARYVRDVLPEKYKRKYKKNSEVTTDIDPKNDPEKIIIGTDGKPIKDDDSHPPNPNTGTKPPLDNSPPPPEDAKDIQIQFLTEENTELKEAMRQLQQFVPATNLPQTPAQDHPHQKIVINEEVALDWLKHRHDGVHRFHYDAYGIDLFKNRELAQLKNSGVKTFKRLYFEV